LLKEAAERLIEPHSGLQVLLGDPGCRIKSRKAALLQSNEWKCPSLRSCKRTWKVKLVLADLFAKSLNNNFLLIPPKRAGPVKSMSVGKLAYQVVITEHLPVAVDYVLPPAQMH
jgi:hypothetical protein